MIIEKLSEKYSKKVFEFCINNDPNFYYIPLDGKVILIDNKYYFRTNSLRKNREEFDSFEINKNPTQEDIRELKRMEKHPQHLYANLVVFKEDYDLILIYSQKSDKEANDEIDMLTFKKLINDYEIDSEDKFLKQLKKQISTFNQRNPNNQTTLNKVLSLK